MISSVIELMCLFWASTFISCVVINARILVYSNESTFQIIDKEADFGINIAGDGLQGLLVVAKPLNACTPIIPRPRVFPYNYKYFFALVEESECDFSQQAIMVQNAGYKAAIIYRKTSNSPIQMGGGKDADKVHIVCVNIGRNSGKILKKYDYQTKTVIKLLPSIKVPIELYLIPFLVVFGVCFLFMAIFSMARYCRYRNNLVNSRLTKENLKCIPTRKFKKGDEYDVCAICLDEFEVGDKLRLLPCSHVYHCKCVDPWLTKGKKSCPVCNRPVSVKKQTKQRRIRSTPSSISSNNEQNQTEEHNEPNERTPLISPENSDTQQNVVVIDV